MSELRELQLKELEILKEFAAVCESEGICYFLNSGTLLGAVRHGGFIPWDDDVDIAMPYEDYERFLACGQEKLGDRFFVQNFETDPNYSWSFTKVRLNGTTCMNSYQAYWDIHHGVWIDIFPIVPLRGKKDFSFTRRILSLCNYFQLDQSLKYYYDEYEKKLGKVGMLLLRAFYLIPMSKRIKLHKSILRHICRRKHRECRSVLWGNITTFYNVNVFDGSSTVIFEGVPFNAPKETDKYLTITYGDYMKLPPEEKRRAHVIDCLDLENDYRQYMKV